MGTMITPQTTHPELAKEIGVKGLYLKREDLHPYGSHKGRSVPVMIDLKASKGSKDFAISSSGNAALAALRHIQKRNIEGADFSLSILIGEHINADKKDKLFSEILDGRIKIAESPRPLQTLFALVKGEKKESLRQSIDDAALIGYESLAEELAAIPDLSAVFMGTSSGTTAQALANYFIKNDKAIAVHIVQTSTVSPIAEEFSPPPALLEVSLADAIVDKVAHRKDALVEAIKKTNGSGWIATNEDISKAQKLMKEKASVDATGNGALALAGLLKARAGGIKFKGTVVCVVGGK
jgi:threonine synthase